MKEIYITNENLNVYLNGYDNGDLLLWIDNYEYEISCSIDKAKAIEIIAFLKEFYKLTEEEIKLLGIK